MAERRNALGTLRVELRPHVVAFTDGAREFHVDITVGLRRFASLNYVLSDDEMRSRFDQLFDIARETLRAEILRESARATDAEFSSDIEGETAPLMPGKNPRSFTLAPNTPDEG